MVGIRKAKLASENVKRERLYLFLLGFGHLADGLVAVLSLGYLSSYFISEILMNEKLADFLEVG